MRDDVINAIHNKLSAFDIFKHVYLFGSVLDVDRVPNDIDILLIYDVYTDEVIQKANYVKKLLEEEFEIPVDLTVLSVNEEKEVEFLSRILWLCIK